MGLDGTTHLVGSDQRRLLVSTPVYGSTPARRRRLGKSYRELSLRHGSSLSTTGSQPGRVVLPRPDPEVTFPIDHARDVGSHADARTYCGFERSVGLGAVRRQDEWTDGPHLERPTWASNPHLPAVVVPLSW